MTEVSGQLGAVDRSTLWYSAPVQSAGTGPRYPLCPRLCALRTGLNKLQTKFASCSCREKYRSVVVHPSN